MTVNPQLAAEREVEIHGCLIQYNPELSNMVWMEKDMFELDGKKIRSEVVYNGAESAYMVKCFGQVPKDSEYTLFNAPWVFV